MKLFFVHVKTGKTPPAEEALHRMNDEEMINVCQAVAHGNVRQVRNLKSKQQGTVISCEGSKLTVRVGQSIAAWIYEDCEEHNPG